MVDSLPAGYVLHARKYTDSKSILTLLVESHGLVRVVARGLKKKKLLLFPQPFTCHLFNWLGSGDLKTLRAWEVNSPSLQLVGNNLFCAIYLNELLCRVLLPSEPCDPIYHCYKQSLTHLAIADGSPAQEQVLRNFELSLLQELGVAVDYVKDVRGQPIANEQRVYYAWIADEGFVLWDSLHQQWGCNPFSGSDLTAIASRAWTTSALRSAKILMRLQLQPFIGRDPLKARDFFR